MNPYTSRHLWPERFGVIMTLATNDPREAWGVLSPRAPSRMIEFISCQTSLSHHVLAPKGDEPMSDQNAEPTSGTDTAAVAVFDNHEFAEAAVKQLADAGLDITKVSVVGRGFHTEEKVTGFYNAGDRIKVWGKQGAFWGGLWGLLLGGLFMTIPFFGPVLVVGHFAMMVVAAAEGAVVVGGLSALGAALYSVGIPKDSALRYEEAVKADGFLVIVHGTDAEVERAKAILQRSHPTQLDMHESVRMNAPVPSPAQH